MYFFFFSYLLSFIDTVSPPPSAIASVMAAAKAKLKEFVKLVKGARSGRLDSIDEDDTDSASPKSLEREFLRSKWAPGWVESWEGGWE